MMGWVLETDRRWRYLLFVCGAGLILFSRGVQASEYEIKVKDLTADPTPACKGCDLTFEVYACDKERDCEPETEGDQEGQNPVKLVWDFGDGHNEETQADCAKSTVTTLSTKASGTR